jgi:hypothetical protein
MYPECWGKDFEFFVEFVSKLNLPTCDAHLRLQTSLFPTGEMSFIGRMENFDEDLQKVMQEIGIPASVPHVGQVAHMDYQAYYSDAMRDRVGNLYFRDVEFGSYQF